MNPIVASLAVLLLVCGSRVLAQDEKPAPPPTQEALAQVVLPANRMLITLPLEEKVEFELRATGLGEEFLGNCQIVEGAPWFHCMCYGDGWITFFRDQQQLAKIGFHHARSIRWIDGPWSSDAELAGDGGIRLCQWFRSKGYPAFDDIRLKHIEWQQSEAKKRRDFAAELPPAFFELLKESDAPFASTKKVARKAMQTFPDRPQLLASIFRAFGHIPTEQTGYDHQMGVARDIVEFASAEDLNQALDLIESDPVGLQGAAYLYCAFPLHKSLPEPSLSAWSVRLAEVVFSTFDGSRRPDAVLRLINTHSPSADDLLFAIASRSRDFPLPRPYIRDEYDDEPDLVTAACVGIAMRGHPQSGDVIRARSLEPQDKQGVAALQVAASLVSSSLEFPKECFRYKSYLIGFGAMRCMEAVGEEKVPAAYMGAALDTPWGAVREEAEKMGARLKLSRARDEPPRNDDEVRFDPQLAQEDPLLAIEEFAPLVPLAIGTTKARLLRARSGAYSRLGRLQEALDDVNAAREIAYQSTDLVDAGRLLWQLGRVNEAVRILSRSYPMSDPDTLETRGVAYLADEQYVNAERDLTAYVLIDNRDAYALFFQHYAAVLSGHPERSRLASERAEVVSDPDEWVLVLMAYILGEKPEAELLAESRVNDDTGGRNEAEALFYVSLSARLKHEAREQELLQHCLSMGRVELTEHWLAQARLARLSKDIPNLAR